jgi:hypothetical protein
VFGILLTALAVQFVFEGVIESGMLPISYYNYTPFFTGLFPHV